MHKDDSDELGAVFILPQVIWLLTLCKEAIGL